MSITWAQAEAQNTYSNPSLTVFNYVVQDLESYLVNQKGMTLVHAGYESAAGSAGCVTSGSAGSGGQAFFVLEPGEQWNFAKRYLIVQGLILPGGQLGIELGLADGIVGWPGAGQVTLPGYAPGTKFIWSSSSNGAGGYACVGALCGRSPSDGLRGVHVVFGADTINIGTALLVNEDPRGTLSLVTNSGVKSVTYTIGGGAGTPFAGSVTRAFGVGAHTIVITCDGEAITRSFTITAEQVTTLTFTFTEHGQIDVTVNPAGTGYTITGPQWPSGQGFINSSGILNIKIGTYTVVATKPLYRNLSVTLTVVKDTTVGGTYTMVLLAGKLRVNTAPSGATVVVT